MHRQAASIPAPAASTISVDALQDQQQDQQQQPRQQGRQAHPLHHQQQHQQQHQQHQRRHARGDARVRGQVDTRHSLRETPPSSAATPEPSANVVAGNTSLEDRRHSLPLHLSASPSPSPSSLSRPIATTASPCVAAATGVWDARTSAEAGHPQSLPPPRGPNVRHEIAAAHRAAALRQLNAPSSRARHRQSKSTGARSDITDTPVVVRTYSGTPPLEHHRHRHHQRHHNHPPIEEEADMARPEMPPVEAFSFDDIMKNVESDVVGALDAIAGICANYAYSPSDHYDAHLPPQAHLGDSDGDDAPPSSWPAQAGRLGSPPPRGRMHAVANAVPITYHSLDAAAMSSPSTNAAPPNPAGRASCHDHHHNRHPPRQGADSGSVGLSESEFHTVSHVGSSPREAPSPMSLVDGSATRRRSHAPSMSSVSSAMHSSTLTSSPAPEVVTEVRRASRPSIDHHVAPSSRVYHSHARSQSMFENFVSWFPWASENDRRDFEGGVHGGGAADSAIVHDAENRLRGLLAGQGSA